MKQQSLFKNTNESNSSTRTYGGSLAFGKRKRQRPLDCKKPIHLVLKSTKSHLLIKKRKQIESILGKMNHRFGIKLHSMAIQHDHIHMNLSFQNRRVYTMWIRAVTGTLVKRISNLKFKFLPFTRIVMGRLDFNRVQNYILQNQAEAIFLEAVHKYIEESRNDIITLLSGSYAYEPL